MFEVFRTTFMNPIFYVVYVNVEMGLQSDRH